MSLPTLFLVALGLAMDAFAAAVAAGVAIRRPTLTDALRISTAFGAFALLMPVLGWLLGSGFRKIVTDWDHWVAFGLLGVVGAKLIYDALRRGRGGKEETMAGFGTGALIVASFATSVDCVLVGVTLAFLDVAIVTAALVIGAVTFLASAIGVRLGRAFGPLLGKKAEIAGGLVLIALGVKILLEDVLV